MKRLFIAACILLGLTSAALACNAHALKSLMVAFTNPYAFDTGKFSCGLSGQPSTEQRMYFENTTGGPIYIKSVTSFLGMSGGGVADMFVRIWRESDHTVFQFTNWDHYKDPTALHNLHDDFGENYIEIPAGDKITLSYSCTKFAAPEVKGHVITRIMYVDALPE